MVALGYGVGDVVRLMAYSICARRLVLVEGEEVICTDTCMSSMWPYMWFRIKGYGLHFMWRTKDWKPLFSERNGYVKSLKLWKLHIKVLTP